MPGEFEQEMQERMQDFTLSPGPHVWKQVEAALPEEKRKSRIAFWWFLPLALLLCGCIWYGVAKNNNQPVAKKEVATQDAGAATNALKTVKPGIETTSIETKVFEQTTPKASIQNAGIKQDQQAPLTTEAEQQWQHKNNIQKNAFKSKPVDNLPSIKTVNPNPSTIVKHDKEEKQLDSVSVRTNDIVENTVNKASYQTGGNGAVSALTAPKEPGYNEPYTTTWVKANKKSSKPIATGIILKDDNTAILNTYNSSTTSQGNLTTTIADTKPVSEYAFDDSGKNDNKTTSLINTANVPGLPQVAANSALPPTTSNDSLTAEDVNKDKTPLPGVIKKENSITWQFFAAAGISNTKAKLFGSQEKSLLNYSPGGLNQGTGSGSGGIDYTPQQPTAGFSYTAGAERFKAIGRRWQWYAAFQYSFLSNQQKTGARKDSAITNADYTGFNNASSRSDGSAPGFYYPGSSITHTNTIHQLGLQTGLQYTINPKGKKPLSFRGGLMANWQVATTQLLYNATKGAYYYALEATHHFTLGTQLGLDWRLTKRLTIGAFFQYNFTRINKPEMGVYLHWQMSGVKVAIPLRRNGLAKRNQTGL